MKKVIGINFLPKNPPFRKKWSNAPPEQFFAVSLKNITVSEKNYLT